MFGRAAPCTHGSAGRRPLAGNLNLNLNSNSNSKNLHSVGWRGGDRWRGTLQVRPCKLGRAIHGAHAPAICPLPASDNFPRLLAGVDPRCWWVSTLVDT